MECYTCATRSPPDHALYCPACARNQLYPLRLDHAKILLDKDRLSREVHTLLKGSEGRNHITGADVGTAPSVHAGTRHVQRQQASQEGAAGQERIRAIIQQSDLLRERIEGYKKDLEAKRAAVDSKRAHLASATAALSTLRSDAISPIRKAIKKVTRRHLSLTQEITSARAYLCTEAAMLFGLRRQRDPVLGNVSTGNIDIGRVFIMDLRQLNEHTPGEISAALANISHLLFLVCYYLGIRLPAELVVSGEQRPQPAICQVASSYRDQAIMEKPILSARDTGLFGLASVHHAAATAVSRPRPLSPEHKLPLLAREDPNAYVKFVQSVVLLAWNIGWLCRTQGLAVAADDWEDVCGMGRNLWQLLASTYDEPIPTGRSGGSLIGNQGSVFTHGSQQTDSEEAGQGAKSTQAPLQGQRVPTSLGVLSHATSGGFLASASAISGQGPEELIRSWKFASPLLVMDKLKSFLLTEMSGLEWEVLDQREYRGIAGTSDDVSVLLQDKPRADTAGALFDGNPDLPALNGAGGEGKSTRGTSGWTKLKSRPSL